MSTIASGTIRGPPSNGSPEPERILPNRSFDTGSLIVSPVNLTPQSLFRPPVPSKTWTTTISSEVSSTCPLLVVPSASVILTSSLYPTGSVFSTKISGPDISLMVLYSFVILYTPQVFKLIIHFIQNNFQCLIKVFLEFDLCKFILGFTFKNIRHWDATFKCCLGSVAPP